MRLVKQPSFYLRMVIEIILMIFSITLIIKIKVLNSSFTVYQNKRLNMDDAKFILSYGNGSSIRYFVYAVIIVLVICGYTVLSFRHIRLEYDKVAAGIAFTLSFLINIGMVIALWIEIDNPIVRAIFVLSGLGVIGCYALSSS